MFKVALLASYLYIVTAQQQQQQNWPTAPTAAVWSLTKLEESLQNARAKCQQANPAVQKIVASTEEAVDNNAAVHVYIKCVVSDLGLWSDEIGYNANRIAKLFAKYQMPIEVIVVVDHCNQQHRQSNIPRWAFDAYKCITSGQIGNWIKPYIDESKETLQGA